MNDKGPERRENESAPIRKKTPDVPFKRRSLVRPAPHPASLAATTTEQEDLTHAGQRKVNLIWERTQAFIAITVVLLSMLAAFVVVVVGRMVGHVASDASLASAWTILATAVGLVVGFYFSRTNHASIGGVGPKKRPEEYEGR
jgi:protein-S-isoprenylcysteine O-methyltransferase Ste14